MPQEEKEGKFLIRRPRPSVASFSRSCQLRSSRKPKLDGRGRGRLLSCQTVAKLKVRTVQGGPSGRGQAFVDIALRVGHYFMKIILWRNF